MDRGSFGPVGRSATELRAFHLRDGLVIDPVALRQSASGSLTMLYRSTDRLCRRGAPVKNLAHSASFDSRRIKNAPSKCGTKHLGMMWAVAFAVAAGSYTFLAVSVIGHTVLIAAAAITVATWTAATAKPELFVRDFARQEQGIQRSNNN